MPRRPRKTAFLPGLGLDTKLWSIQGLNMGRRVKDLQSISAHPIVQSFKSHFAESLKTLVSHCCCASTAERKPVISDLSAVSIKMSLGELAAGYAVLILHDDNIPVTAEKITTLVKAAKIDIESYWAMLFAKLAEKKNIEDLILNAGGGGAPVAVAAPVAAGGAAAAAPAAPAAEEKKKEEPQEESDDDMGFSLFD
ncbi:hypothetical protein L6164_021288 [Bauhinia variegata]|uniref:Uncharacterized protein n=1 Tax=Bauhinia variegata TaxID=167791 RepID=A0ACB9MXQ4_BAUVA|nr:hypothetical protein L6164_021288 [Bauhinia variegata]